MRAVRPIFCLLAMATAAVAQPVDSATCPAALARAEALVDQVAARDRAGPPATAAALCAALRRNARDMREARDIMQRCLRGHAARENVGQMDAARADVAMAIRRRCGNP